MSEKILAKAKQYLCDGKVLVLWVKSTNSGDVRSSAQFAVQGSAASPYIVDASGDHWNCGCPAYEDCAHIQACRLIYKSPEPVTRIFATDEEINNLFARIGSN